MRKRGQVTAFIILGVILVILVVLGVYYRDFLVRSLSSVGIGIGIKVPQEFEELNSRVEDCVRIVSEDGIRLLGSQGGYISIPEDILPAGPANPFSNRLLVFPNSDLEVPYWFYISANNIPKNSVPTMQSMEKELSSYIDSNLDSCIDNFSDFNRFEIVQKAHKASASIGKDSVLVSLSYPISASLEGSEYTFRNFNVEVDAALGKLYSMAKQIYDSESNTFFLEEKTYDVLVLYDEIPLFETDFSCSPKVWSKSQVVSDLKRVLSYNIPAVKVKGTDYTSFEGREYFEWDALGTSYKGTNANLMYSESWPLYLDVAPSEGDLLKGDSMLDKDSASILAYLSALFCLNQYHFVYDIRHPVLVTLHDSSSFGNSGLDFQYATQVVIDNNQPREDRSTDLGLPDVDAEICKYATSKVTVNVLKSSVGGFVPVPDADVSYKCINNLCPIGKTGADGSLTANFPPCVNGAVTARKDGLHEGKTTFSTNEAGSSTSVILDPYYEVKADVRVLSPSIRNPLASEKVVFSFNNKEAGYSTYLSYPEQKSVKLIAGSYEVTSYVIEENAFEITLQGREVQSCSKVPSGVLGIFGVEEEKCFPVKIPPTKLSSIVKGGANFEFKVGRDDLASASKVVLYTVADRNPSKYEDLVDVYSGLADNSKKSFFIYPRFER